MARRVLVVSTVAAVVLGTLVWMRQARELPEVRNREVAPASAGPVAGAAEVAPTTALAGGGAKSAAFDRDRRPEPWSEPPSPPAQPAGSRPRSPLERSPGYFPPDDPESASVVTGRREAKAVDLPFSGGASTREDLAQMLLAALNARDEKAFHALRVTREEFAAILWPEFPESRPITNITADDAWGMAIAQSVAGAGRAVGQYGGRDLTLLRVEVGSTMPYRNFVLYRDVALVVRDRATGIESRLRFAPSFVERQGRVKALIFRD